MTAWGPAWSGPPAGPWPGRLLVATPQLVDPHFVRAVILLLQHDGEDGALGIVLTRPTQTAVGEVLPGWAERAAEPTSVFSGGPVQPQAAICLGRVRPGTPAGSTFAPLADPQLGTVDLDADPVDGLLEVRVYAGYAGWAAGQLEAEVEEGAWWVLDALPRDAFTAEPDRLWRLVLLRQGLPLAFAASYPADPALN